MSKIGSNANITQQIFKPIVSTLKYDDLDTYRTQNTSIGIANGLIFSIPLDNNQDDYLYESSIWITDNNGLLHPISYPIAKIKELIDDFENYKNNLSYNSIVSVHWNVTNLQSDLFEPLLYNDATVQVEYGDKHNAEQYVTGIEVYEDPSKSIKAKSEWTTTPGTYYLVGLVYDKSTGAIIKTQEVLQYIIKDIVKIKAEFTITQVFYGDPIGTSVDIKIKSTVEGELTLRQNADDLYNVKNNIIKVGPDKEAIFQLYTKDGVYESFNPKLYFLLSVNDNKRYEDNIGLDVQLDTPMQGYPVPYTYYWYSGITKPTAENIASIATGSSKSIESWQGKEFAVTNNANTPQYAYFCTPADYNVTWWDGAHTAKAQPSDNYKGTFTYNNVTYVYWWRAKTLQSNATLPFYAWTN